MPRINKLKEFLEDDPKDSFSRYALAMEYIKLNRFETALEEFETIVKNDSSYLPTYYQMAKAYEHEGKTDLAERSYRTGIDVASSANDVKTMNELSEALNILLGSDL